MTGKQFNALKRLFAEDGFVDSAFTELDYFDGCDEDDDIKLIERLISEIETANPDGVDDNDEPINVVADEDNGEMADDYDDRDDDDKDGA